MYKTADLTDVLADSCYQTSRTDTWKMSEHSRNDGM